jgi:hypothetical protein
MQWEDGRTEEVNFKKRPTLLSCCLLLFLLLLFHRPFHRLFYRRG